MKELIKQYEIAKNKAKMYMKKGQINAYFEALLEMNKYKRMMVAVVANQISRSFDFWIVGEKHPKKKQL